MVRDIVWDVSPQYGRLKDEKMKAPTKSRTDLAAEFRTLVSSWRKETSHMSNATKMAMHPSYQRIIGMGPDALPLILAEMKREPDHWFWALHAISGQEPAGPDDDFHGAVAAWLRWGMAHGYLE